MLTRRMTAGVLGAGAALAVSSSLFAPGAAATPTEVLAVWPTGCETTIQKTGGRAYCSGGAGTYQVIVTCEDGSKHYGPWVGIRRSSWAFCSSNGTVRPTSIAYNLRSG